MDNSLGSYTWAVDCALGDDATYGIKIIYDNDATGVTFQYSNPFAISKAATTSSASSASSAAPTTSSAVTVEQGDASPSTVYSTEYMTITSCAASVTDCPARSTVVSSTSYPVVATGSGSAPAVSSNAAQTGAPSSFTSVSPVVTSAPAPLYPAGNATGAGLVGVGGTVTLSTKTTTGGASAATTSAITTSGAGRVAMGGVAAIVGLAAAVFTL